MSGTRHSELEDSLLQGNCFAGPDDRLALSFVVQLCNHESLSATILRMRKIEDEVYNEVARPQEALTTDSGGQARQVLEGLGVPLPIMGRVDQSSVSTSDLTGESVCPYYRRSGLMTNDLVRLNPLAYWDLPRYSLPASNNTNALGVGHSRQHSLGDVQVRGSIPGALPNRNPGARYPCTSS